MKIKMLGVTLSFGASALLLVGCAPASQPPAPAEQTSRPVAATPPPPPNSLVSLNAEMVSVVDHAGHGLWDAEREGRAPKTQQDWEMVAEHAVQVIAAGTLITIPGTGPNDVKLTQEADWRKWARAMSDAGMAAFKASEAKDMKALVVANGQLVEACEGCHQAYKPNIPSEGITHQHMHVERR
jgi:hypothetical protein